MARAIPDWWRHRSFLRRHASGTCLPNRHEPLRQGPPALAPDWLHRMDRRVRSGRVRVLALHNRFDICSRRHQVPTTVVSACPSLLPNLSIAFLLYSFRAMWYASAIFIALRQGS